MGRLPSVLMGALSLMLSAGAALAADLSPPPVIEYPPVVPVEIGSGWYLRGDIGYKRYNTPKAHFDLANYGDMIDESLSDTGTVGVGAGYRFNRFFRMDLTLDYEWPGNFHGRLPCPTCTPGLYSDEFADISVWTGLINAYFDLGTYGHVTPYLGAGIGASAVSSRNVHFVNPDTSTGSWGGATTWNLAWALMAGTTIDLSRNWALDLNYRYLHIGNGESGPTDVLNAGQPIHYDGLAAHEVRVGLRYMLR